MKKGMMSLFYLCAIGSTLFVSRNIQAEETVVEYEVTGQYTLVIPSRVTLNTNSSTTMAIKTVNRNLEPDKEVEVLLTDGLASDGEIELTRVNASGALRSSIKVEGNGVKATNPIIGKFSGFVLEETEIASIEFGAPQGQRLAGVYDTTLTFAASYID